MGRKLSIQGRTCPYCKNDELFKISGRKPVIRARCKVCNKTFNLSKAGYKQGPRKSKDRIPYVFQRDDNGFYAAFIPTQLEQPVMTDIVQNLDGTWSWNCYHIGRFQTRNELVRWYLYIDREFGIYDYEVNDLNEVFQKAQRDL